MSKCKVLFKDYGLFPYVAQLMAKSGYDVFYHTPWMSSYPSANKAQIGEGLEGINSATNFYEAKRKLDKKNDIIVFFDVGEGAEQQDLREQGYNVFGSGAADILEMNRLKFKQVLKEIGLPVIPYKHITGIVNLVEYLKTHEDKFVKLSFYRGLRETFHHISWKHSESIIDKLKHDAKAIKRELEFIVEDPIDGEEGGNDWGCGRSGYLNTGIQGFEEKDKGYIAKILRLEDLPKPLAEVMDAIEPWLIKNGMQGMFSTEVRIEDLGPEIKVSDGLKPFWNDATMRGGSPPTELQCIMWTNLPEVIEAIAKGDDVDLIPEDKNEIYGAQIVLKSDWARTETTCIEFPPKFKDNLKFMNLCKEKGNYLYIPQDEDDVIGSAVGKGKTLIEAQMKAIDAAESVIANGIHYDESVFDTLDETLEKTKKMGMKF